MARYGIEETTLTNIADAIREQVAKNASNIKETVVGTAVSKTVNASSFDTFSGTYPISASITDVVTIPGAEKIKVKIAYQTEGTSYDYVTITPQSGDATDKLGGKTLTIKEFEFPGTNSVSFYFKSDSSGSNYLGYYAEVTGVTEVEVELPTPTYTPIEMATTISELNVMPEGKGVLTGDISSLFSMNYLTGTSDSAKAAYKKYFTTIVPTFITKDITDASYLFNANPYIYKVPFTINVAEGSEGNFSFFGYKSELRKAPKIIGKIGNLNSMFRECAYLNDVSELENYEFDDTTTSNYSDYMFGSCSRLRHIPSSFLKRFGRRYHTTSSNYAPGSNVFYQCFSLDEVVDFGVTEATIASSAHYNVAYYTWHLKRWTFETNEDGTPKTANWHTQTLDFSNYVGYTNGTLMTTYGFTTNTRITDDTTYQALKDDPDAWTTTIAYSRYNHDSAVETINSLPDTSAFLAANAGTTNTIKFKGTNGSSTDGGAINTLTEEEIAVAAAKGWTVTLV